MEKSGVKDHLNIKLSEGSCSQRRD